ncbi:MAG: Flp pilus assembly protein CpaB [Aestuariivirgaceae bacterium]|nr:Flp pilus assembly protein CpaB [Aestuariivirgaceae bacterium]
MNRARIVVILTAAIFAVGVAWFSDSFLGGNADAPSAKAEGKEVLVAAHDLGIGEALGPQATRWTRFPEESVTPAMITRKTDPAILKTVEQSRAIQPIFKGEPINEQKIAKADNKDLLSSMLPKGLRAVTISLNEESGVGGFILPNDRVDVLVIRKIGKKSSAETVITNVRVLALDQSTQPVKKDDKKKTDKKGGFAKTATLELEPQQAVALATAASSGKISLSLRSLAENEGQGLEGAGPKLNQAFGQPGKSIGLLRYGVKSIVQVGP